MDTDQTYTEREPLPDSELVEEDQPITRYDASHKLFNTAVLSNRLSRKQKDFLTAVYFGASRKIID